MVADGISIKTTIDSDYFMEKTLYNFKKTLINIICYNIIKFKA